MLIKTIEVGHYSTNCYIATDERTLECAVIDPGDESNSILHYLEDNNLKCKYIFITHGHFDHTGAAETVMQETGAAMFIHELDTKNYEDDIQHALQAPSGTVFYKEGDSFDVGDMTFTVIETPGHSPGGVVLRCGDVLFTGDTLFAGSCGRTDLTGGNMDILMGSLKKLYLLEGDYEIYPGHMGPSTLQHERDTNYYMTYAMNK